MKGRICRLEVGLAHAVGAALRPVLGLLLLRQVATRLFAPGGIRAGQQCAATAGSEQGNGNAARRGQLHAGSTARSTRYGLKRISPENHGMGS